MDENHTLSVTFTASGGAQRTLTLAVRVIDQYRVLAPAFNVTEDFSRDQTGFFAQASRRDLVRQAAEDWTYFFAGINLDLVAAGAEHSVTEGNLAARPAGGVPRSVISYPAPLPSCLTPTHRQGHSAGRPRTPLLGCPAPLLAACSAGRAGAGTR